VTRANIDNTPRAEGPVRGCWYGRVVPCPNGGETLHVATAGLADGAHDVHVWAFDASGNGGLAYARYLAERVPEGNVSR
jgi:hypothetical protein